MDVEGRRDFWNAIRRDAERGRTVLFATHYLEEADAYADRIILMRQGKIVADGSATEIKNLVSGRVVRRTLPAPIPRPSRLCPASTRWRSRATRSCTRRTRTPSPGTCSPPPRRAISRSPPRTSRASSWRSPSESPRPPIRLRTEHATSDITLDRSVTARGGFTLTYLRIELPQAPQPRSILFTVAFPVLMFFIVGIPLLGVPLTDTADSGGVSVAAYIMVSMAMYGTMMSATADRCGRRGRACAGLDQAAAAHAPESRRERRREDGRGHGVRPPRGPRDLHGGCRRRRDPRRPIQWLATGLAAWVLAGAVFTTLGLMVGYMVPGENAAQITSLAVVLLSFLGGLFYPSRRCPISCRSSAS